MQDNLHEDMFADLAWQEMHKILDREMPERKRRGLWLWFLPAFGLCVLLGRDTLLENHIPVAIEKAQQKRPPIAQLEGIPGTKSEIQRKIDPETPNKPSPKASPDKLPEAIAKVSPLTESVALQDPVEGKRAVNFKTQQELLEKAEGISTAGEILPTQTLGKPASTLPLAHQAEELAGISSNAQDKQDLLAIDKASIVRWSTAQVLATREFGLDLPAVAVEQVEIKPQHRKQKLEWWAEAGTQLASGVSGFSGYQAGLLSAIPIGRMRLQTGLAYEKTEVGFQSIQRDALTGKENLSDVKLATPDQPSLGVSAGNAGAQSVSSITLQFINLNLSLYQPFGKRFGIAFGGNVHYLGGIKLGDRYLRSTLFDNTESRYQFAASNGNIFVPQSGDLSKASFRSFGLSMEGTLSYRLATRWSANLAYRQSLQHFTKTSDLLLKPNWLDFGVQYRLK